MAEKLRCAEIAEGFLHYHAADAGFRKAEVFKKMTAFTITGWRIYKNCWKVAFTLFVMQVKESARCYNAIKEDSRISPRYIPLFMALFERWNRNDFQNPVAITRQQVTQAAKISGLATYRPCIKELHDYEYIAYSPLFNAQIKSQLCIVVQVEVCSGTFF